jgi:hypothetical protein
MGAIIKQLISLLPEKGPYIEKHLKKFKENYTNNGAMLLW